MHEYVSSNSHRKDVIVILTVISLLINCALTPLCNLILEKLYENLELVLYPFIILLSVSFSLVFSFLYFLFNNFIWKIIPGIKKQNINGSYVCEGVSSYKGASWQGTVKINQTWSKIFITLQTQTSSSNSYMANIAVNENGSIQLNYCYMNKPNGIDKALKKHEGTAEIIFYGKDVSGKYYNYPLDRPRYGTLILHKQEKK